MTVPKEPARTGSRLRRRMPRRRRTRNRPSFANRCSKRWRSPAARSIRRAVRAQRWKKLLTDTAPALIAEGLDRFGQARVGVDGISMLPAIRPGDVLLIAPRTITQIMPADIVLFTVGARFLPIASCGLDTGHSGSPIPGDEGRHPFGAKIDQSSQASSWVASWAYGETDARAPDPSLTLGRQASRG